MICWPFSPPNVYISFIASVFILKNFFLSFFLCGLLLIGKLNVSGSVVFYYYIIYLIGFDFPSFTKPKSNDFLPFNRFDKAGAWGPTSVNYCSSLYFGSRSGFFYINSKFYEDFLYWGLTISCKSFYSANSLIFHKDLDIKWLI